MRLDVRACAMSEQLLPLAEAARLLACSERTIRRRIDCGALPVFRDGRILRIRERDLRAYIAARTSGAETRQPRARSPRRPLELPPGRSLFELPEPLLDLSADVELMSRDSRRRPGDANTPRGRQQGASP